MARSFLVKSGLSDRAGSDDAGRACRGGYDSPFAASRSSSSTSWPSRVCRGTNTDKATRTDNLAPRTHKTHMLAHMLAQVTLARKSGQRALGEQERVKAETRTERYAEVQKGKKARK
eukprot:3543417-Pleurochrysis_carterae.AAC.3